MIEYERLQQIEQSLKQMYQCPQSLDTRAKLELLVASTFSS
jgi:hypothetical protein